MQTLFDLLADKYPSAAQCAAALGLTRQAYSQAQKRRQLSNPSAIKAAALLDIDAGKALLINATAKDIPAPVSDPCPNPATDQTPAETLSPALYYVNSTNQHQRHDDSGNQTAGMKKNVHSIFSTEKENALDIIRWRLAVARLPADSPRFNYYVSRWNVPDKIATAKAAGTFDDAIKNCPPYDPSWVRLVPAALAECQRFIEQTATPRKTATSSSTKAKGRNIAPLAA